MVSNDRTMNFPILFIISVLAVSSHAHNKGIGGNPAMPRQYPYHAAMFMNGNYLCSGTLLSTQWVLTSGVCTVNARVDANSVVVALGGISNEVIHETGRHDYPVMEVFTHPRFSFYFADNLGLLKLAFPIQISEYIRPVDMPRRGEVLLDNVEVLTLGYIDHFLRFGIGKTMDKETCQSFDWWNRPEWIDDMVACLRHDEPQNNFLPCDQDEYGAAMIEQRPTGWTVLVGLVGFAGCDEKPTAYVRIEPYLPWIQEVTGLYLP